MAPELNSGSKDNGYVLLVDLKTNGGKFDFKNTEEIKEWFKKEKEAWSWLRQLSGLDSAAQTAKNITVNSLNDVESSVNALNVTNANSFVTLKNKIENLYVSINLPYSNTPKMKYILDLASQNAISALHGLSYYLNVNVNFNSVPYQKIIIATYLFESGLSNRADSEVNALNNLYLDLTTKLSETIREKSELEVRIKNSFSALDELLKTQTQIFEKSGTEFKREHEDLLKTATQELKNIEVTYDKKLSLQSSVKYWNDKAEIHKKWSRIFTMTMIFVFMIFTFSFIKTTDKFVGAKTILDISISQLGLLSIGALFGIWTMRVLARILLSHIHLFTESNERKTMLQTYLALLRKGQIKDKDQELVLQALFRPTSTGIIKDDAAPPFLAEWLKRATGND